MYRLAVFPNDPLRSYYEKGEIKPRYFNPCNLFEEVHFISICDNEVPPELVQSIAGQAKIYIHPIGRPNIINLWQYFKKAADIITRIKPDIIRAYNPSITGAMAVYGGKKNKIPTVISIHADYNPFHNLRIFGFRMPPLRFLREIFSYYFVEPYCYRNATAIYGVYEFNTREARKYRNDVQIICNRVYLDKYVLADKNQHKKFRIICVGRHIPGKNPENLIKAMSGLENAELILIGYGPLTEKLKKITTSLGLDEKIIFIKSVPNAEIHKYYLESDIFAQPLEYGGISVPMLEAMAAGLPVIVPYNRWSKTPDVIGDLAILVKNSPDGFRNAILKLMENPEMIRELGQKCRKLIEQFSGEKMEEKEKELYLSLLKGK